MGMFFGVGILEMLFMLLVSSGGQAGDLVSFIDAESYFKWKNVPVSTAKMIELAQLEPKDGKTQFAQLLALQYLQGQADKLKKDASYQEYRRVLEAIAGGSKARDPLGFSSRYGSLVLDKIDGRSRRPKTRSLVEGVTWFPADVSLVACLDLRNNDIQATDTFSATRAKVFAKMAKETKADFFEMAETLGNIEIERIAFAYQEKGKKKGWVRLSGTFTQERVVAVYKMVAGKLVVESRQSGTETITTIAPAKSRDEPGAVLVGNGDIVFALADDPSEVPGMLAQVLRLRTGQEHAGTGTLKKKLDQVSPKAAAMTVGALPLELVRDLTRGGPFSRFPKRLVGEALAGPVGIDIQIRGELDNAEDSGKFVEEVAKLRKEALDLLANLKNNSNLPIPIGPLEKTVESMQIQGQGNQASFRMLVSMDLLRGLAPLLNRELGGVGN